MSAILCALNDMHDKKLQSKHVCKLWVFSNKSLCKKRFIGDDHDKTSRLGSYL